MIMQERNPELVDILRTDFQHRNEPNFAQKSVVSTFLALPGLRAFWPMSSIDFTEPLARDVAGGGYHLSSVNGPVFGYDNLIPIVEFDGVNQYLGRASAIGNWATVQGNEAHIIAAQRGLTLGGWVNTTTIAAGTAGAVAKWDINNRSYLLVRSAGNIELYVSVNGAAALGPSSLAIAVDTWYFIVGRWIPDAANSLLKLWVNSDTDENNIGAAATLFDGAAPFSVSFYEGANYWSGKESMIFLCQLALSDALIFTLFQQTRAMFGV